ncbi:unnamed protein product [Aspergillus oryzae]|nr:unnamed protein product [Aspergillus oryzae]
MYLTRIGTDFQNLVRAGVEGLYGSRDAFFDEFNGEKDYHRLRTAVHMANGRFANYMRQHGQKRKIVSAEGQEGTDSDTDQILIYDRTRGRELPGNYNHALFGELFNEQSSRWADIAREHVTTIADLVSRFIQAASEFVIKDPSARDNILRIIVAKLDENAECAFHELCKLLDDEAGCPITYNYYHTDSVQKARNKRSRQDLGTSLNNAINKDWNGRFHVSNSSDEISRLVASLQNYGVIVDMEARACYEAQIEPSGKIRSRL